MLTWRVYRDRSKAPVPVLRASEPLYAYAFDPADSGGKEPVVVPKHTQWFAPTSVQGQTHEEPKERLESSLLAKEPVVVKEASSGEWQLVGAQQAKPVYAQPGLVSSVDSGPAPSLFCPYKAVDKAEHRHLVASEANSSGVYYAYRGYLKGPSRVLVNGEDWEDFQYDSYHGSLLVLRPDGEPFSGAFVEVEFGEGPSSLLSLSEHTQGAYVLLEDLAGRLSLSTATEKQRNFSAQVLGRLEVTALQEFTDTRRRSADSGEGPAPNRSGVVGKGHFGASPVSGRHMWVVQTDADPKRALEAAKRTLPGGSLIRVEPLDVARQSLQETVLLQLEAKEAEVVETAAGLVEAKEDADTSSYIYDMSAGRRRVFSYASGEWAEDTAVDFYEALGEKTAAYNPRTRQSFYTSGSTAAPLWTQPAQVSGLISGGRNTKLETEARGNGFVVSKGTVSVDAAPAQTLYLLIRKNGQTRARVVVPRHTTTSRSEGLPLRFEPGDRLEVTASSPKGFSARYNLTANNT